MGKLILVCIALCLGFMLSADICQAKVLTRDDILKIARDKLNSQNIGYEEANIVFDKEGRIWSEKGIAILESPANPNHGILPHGILRNKKYDVVLFDYDKNAKQKDVWVFVDSATGDVITIYREI